MKELKEKNYLPILELNDGTPVTKENWEQRKAEMLDLLQKYSYGYTPKTPVKVSGELKEIGRQICAGICKDEIYEITYETEFGKSSFPIEIFTPISVEKPPVFLHIAFGKTPNKFMPLEEIMEAGYAVVVVDYCDLVNDNHHGDYSDGVAKHFGTTINRGPEEWGKIGMWAWGASRVMDFLVEQRTDLDLEKVVVIGHSRLGKTALWCVAQDPRFAGAISNNSGYGGAASSKYGTGENVSDFLRVGSWDWYCENFKKFGGELEHSKPYDQSFLLALIAPRLLLVGSAKNDWAADPEAEFLTSLHASPAWELYGEKGLITPEEMPKTGAFLGEGNILYHYREGEHYLSRHDWHAYIKFLDKKFNLK